MSEPQQRSPAQQATAGKTRLLIVEDDEGLRRQYRWAFPDFDLSLAGTREEALAFARRANPPVVILDLGLPPDPDGASEGLATLEAIRQLAPDTKIVIASGNETREHALKAIEIGAYDFYQKPIDLDVLRLIVDRAMRLHALEAEIRRLAMAQPASAVDGILANSPNMTAVLRTIEKVAQADVSVMLLGESGTGKELLAQAVHRLSSRSKGPFVAINCAAIPETLLESELFGHEKGAFTGAVKQTVGRIESAHGGTLFLDEIGDVPMAMQVKLLRFLQDHVIERVGGRQPININARIVCATHRNLDELLAAGRFREDLFYRLNEVQIAIPPLRERDGDPLLLARYFARKFNAEFGRSTKGFTAAALSAIKDNEWRGNVRELENRIKRAVVMAEGPLIDVADLGLAVAGEPVMSLDIREARGRAERQVLQLALAQANGNLSQAARLLGVSRPTLYELLREHGFAAQAQEIPRAGIKG